MIAVIDIGGTQIKYGVMDEALQSFIPMGKLDTQTGKEAFSVVDRLDVVIERIMQQYPLEGLAISTAGTVNPSTGEIVYANKNIPNYKGTQLKQILENRYKVPCEVENDVNCALLGELHFGQTQAVESALMLTIGTGVGGALYLNRSIYHGHSFSAGEIGYSSLNQNNIETRISTTALINRVQNEFPEVVVDGYWIFEQARKSNQQIDQIIDEFLDELCQVIINFVSLLNPELVILGGGIMEQKDYLSDKIHEKFSKYPNKYVFQRTQLTFASLGNQAGMLGAYYHFREMQKSVNNS